MLRTDCFGHNLPCSWAAKHKELSFFNDNHRFHHDRHVSRRVSGCKTWCSVQGDADLHSTVEQQSSEIASLREQCSNHAKERAALKTILDAKIKALVDDIGQSVSDLPPEVSHHARLAALTLPGVALFAFARHELLACFDQRLNILLGALLPYCGKQRQLGRA